MNTLLVGSIGGRPLRTQLSEEQQKGFGKWLGLKLRRTLDDNGHEKQTIPCFHRSIPTFDVLLSTHG